MRTNRIWLGLFVVLAVIGTMAVSGIQTFAATESGSVGLQGKISAPPPTTGATISIPRSGQTFNSLPITVSGICPKGLIVKLFKNNVFSGSADCTNGSFSIISDLFSGANELIARVYDSLDQAGPDSNKVNVTFNDPAGNQGARVTVTSNFAKRGAPPGETLTWPLTLSGGVYPYAVSIDWGDKKTADLVSRQFPGDFEIKHIYDSSGVYNIIVKVTDKNGATAFLQLVGIANGPISQTTQDGSKSGTTVITKTTFLWWPVLLLIPLTIIAFWLGHRHQMHVIRRRIIDGERPF